MKATSRRRQLIMGALLGLAAIGAATRHWADNPSLLRDIGTLFMVLWLPAVGNLVAFVVRRLARRAAPVSGFASGSAFSPHLWAEFEPLVPAPSFDPPLDPLVTRCTALVGTAGFTIRLGIPVAQWLESGSTRAQPIELLRPALALPRLAPSTTFHVMAGAVPIARGRVTAFAAPSGSAPPL